VFIFKKQTRHGVIYAGTQSEMIERLIDWAVFYVPCSTV